MVRPSMSRARPAQCDSHSHSPCHDQARDCSAAAKSCGAGETRNPKVEPWHDLRDRFIEISCSRRTPRERAVANWQLLVEHPWYDALLESCAKRVLRHSYLPACFVEDVKQEAALRLITKLLAHPDLRVDYDRVQRHFPGWMYRIIHRDCQQVVRKLRRWHQQIELHETSAWSDPRGSMDARLDFESALEQLDDVDSTTMVLYAQGYSIKEIAQAIGCGDRQAYRVLNRAKEHVERALYDPFEDRL